MAELVSSEETYETVVRPLVVKVAKKKGRALAVHILRQFTDQDDVPCERGQDVRPVDYPDLVKILEWELHGLKYQHEVEELWVTEGGGLNDIRTLLAIRQAQGWEHYYSEIHGSTRLMFFKREVL